MRLALGVAYNGASYNGWQYQTHSITLQEQVEKAVSHIANEKVTVVCAGRTDAGVHATQQIIHFDTQANRSIEQWLLGINAKLPPDINIHWVKEVSDNFHARFSATQRRYIYIIYINRIRPCFLDKQVTWLTSDLDVGSMHEAAQFLLGKNDFSAFRASACQAKTAIREVKNACVKKQGNFIIFDISANAFLHHMVRNIIGSLIMVGKGEQPSDWIAKLIADKDRTKSGPTAKPHGLYLVDVSYPEAFGLFNKVEMPFYISEL
jgi:tRNA pseudouridine38-40 synthase